MAATAAGSVTSQTSFSPINGIDLWAARSHTSSCIRRSQEWIGGQAFGPLAARPIAMEVDRPGSHVVRSSSNRQATIAASSRTLRRREADRKVTVLLLNRPED